MTTLVKQSAGTCIFSESGVTGTKKLASETLEFVVLNLDPSAVIQPHQLPMVVTFFVKDGQGSIQIDDESVRVEAGDLVEVPAGKNRAWRNTGDVQLIVLAVKLL